MHLTRGCLFETQRKIGHQPRDVSANVQCIYGFENMFLCLFILIACVATNETTNYIPVQPKPSLCLRSDFEDQERRHLVKSKEFSLDKGSFAPEEVEVR